MNSFSDWLDKSTQNKYPVVGNYPHNIISSPIKNPSNGSPMAEYWNKGEEDSPTPGRDTFGGIPGESSKFLLGEYMHILANKDPYYKYMAGKFTGGMSPTMRNRVTNQYGNIPLSEDKPKDFNSYWNQEGREAYLRAGVLPEEFGGGPDPKEWPSARKMYTPRQEDVVGALRSFMTRPMYDYGSNSKS